MRFHIQAELTYDFAEPCEVLLLLEAARGADQAVHRERLAVAPAADVARLDDSLTGERRAVFTAQGRVALHYEADVEVLARHAALEGVAAVAIRGLAWRGAALSPRQPLLPVRPVRELCGTRVQRARRR